ncbi:MAG: hypothetical protein AAB448_01005 [Patescibacteria group bacterium]
MEKFIQTLHDVEIHGYKVEELPGILPFSEEQKRNFLLKQILMRVATSIGEIATLSEPEVPQSNTNENLLKDSIAKLFMNVLRLAKIQNLDEELLYADVQRLLLKA